MESLRREDVDVKTHIVNDDLRGAQKMAEFVRYKMQRIKSERDERPDNYTERSPKRRGVEVQVMEELFVGSCSRTLPDGSFSRKR